MLVLPLSALSVIGALAIDKRCKKGVRELQDAAPGRGRLAKGCGLIEWLEAHANLSGWAQAIGALLSLWVAIVLPEARQARRSRAARRAVAIALDSSTIWLGEMLAGFYRTPLLHPEAWKEARRRAGVNLDNLRSMPVADLPATCGRLLHEYDLAAAWAIQQFDGHHTGQFPIQGQDAAETYAKLLQLHDRLLKKLDHRAWRAQHEQNPGALERELEKLNEIVASSKNG